MTTQVFWGFIKIMILEAFYAASSAPQPMSFAQVVAYVWLGQAFLGLLPWSLDRDIREMIRTGSVSYELLRPLDLYWIWYFRAMAWRTAVTLLRCIPLIVFAGLLLRIIGMQDIALSLPPDVPAFLFFTASLILALFLSCALTTQAHILMMWTISGEGAVTIIGVAMTIFSGMIIPLPLFPDWMQLFFRLLPFHCLVDAPYRIYSGNIVGTEAAGILLQQAAWLVAILAIGRMLARRGMRRLVVQGG
jgi:ABC-2 type transport system permease protein